MNEDLDPIVRETGGEQEGREGAEQVSSLRRDEKAWKRQYIPPTVSLMKMRPLVYEPNRRICFRVTLG